jgi:hypothetical protein
VGYYGYVKTDSANLREGDVVVIAKVDTANSVTRFLGGHAGIFVQWAAGPAAGGYSIGWANNGLPASKDHPNKNNPTGIYNFKIKDPNHWHLFFFRQATP